MQAPPDIMRTKFESISPNATCGSWQHPQTGDCTLVAMVRVPSHMLPCDPGVHWFNDFSLLSAFQYFAEAFVYLYSARALLLSRRA